MALHFELNIFVYLATFSLAFLAFLLVIRTLHWLKCLRALSSCYCNCGYNICFHDYLDIIETYNYFATLKRPFPFLSSFES